MYTIWSVNNLAAGDTPLHTRNPLNCTWYFENGFWKMDRDKLNFWSISNLIFTACVSCKVQIRNKPKTSYRNPFFKIKCRSTVGEAGLQPKPTFLEPYNTQRCVLSVSSPMDLLLPDRKLTKHTPVQWHKYGTFPAGIKQLHHWQTTRYWQTLSYCYCC